MYYLSVFCLKKAFLLTICTGAITVLSKEALIKKTNQPLLCFECACFLVLLNAELSLFRYWWGPKLEKVRGEGGRGTILFGSSVQFKMVSMHLGRPICAPPHLSEVCLWNCSSVYRIDDGTLHWILYRMLPCEMLHGAWPDEVCRKATVVWVLDWEMLCYVEPGQIRFCPKAEGCGKLKALKHTAAFERAAGVSV